MLVPLIHPAVSTAPAKQNPSPMVEHTREHPRLEKRTPAGERFETSMGTLFIPGALKAEAAAEAEAGEPERVRAALPLLIHFHGGNWIPEVAGEAAGAASLAVQLGSGSSTYARPFREKGRFGDLLAEAEKMAGVVLRPVTLSGWSAGCGAIREILKDPANDARIDRVILIDGVHTGYPTGKPGPLESVIDPEPLRPSCVSRAGRWRTKRR